MRDIVLALIIFGTLPFILMRPYFGLLVWSWLDYMSPHRLTFGFAYNFPWVQIVAITTLLSLVFGKEPKRMPVKAVTLLLFAFLVWTGITTIFAVEPALAWQKYIEFSKTLIMVFATLMLVNDRERMHWLMWVIVGSLGFYGVKGGVWTLLHGGVNHVLGPPGTFIADNNALALALSMTIPLMRYLQLHSTNPWVRRGLVAAMLLTGIAVLGTYSRGGMIALVIVAGALFVKSRGRLVVIAAAVVVGLVAWHFMPPDWTARMATLHDASQTSSGETRIQSWMFATNVAIHKPVFGGGFDVYLNNSMWLAYGPDGAIRRAIHSIYFRMLGEQGFIGLGLFLALLAATWLNCSLVRRRTRRELQQRWAFDLASMLQVTLVAFMVAGALLPMPYFDFAWQLMAVSTVLLARVTQEQMEAFAATRKPHGGAAPAAVISATKAV